MRGRLLACAGAGLAMLVAGYAVAQEKFPNQPLKIIVAFAPGSATDVSARVLAEHMRAAWGRM